MECEICMNHWNSENRIPKILPCGHTFCQLCLYDLVDKYSIDNVFKCPNCHTEIPTILNKKDISNLQKNIQLLSLLDKVETQKSRANLSNISMSMSVQVNTSYLNSDSYNHIGVDDFSSGNNNNYFYPLCNSHKNKAIFYNYEDGRMNYVCNDCMQCMELNNLIPLPNLKAQNEFKIDSCKNRAKILRDEIDRVENFLVAYQHNFENDNKKKIDELFDYINKIIIYNHTTALTLFNQCKNEQNAQINKKIKELGFLRNELDIFDKKLDELYDINDKKPEPESQLELDNVFNKLANYINYENELNLFQMNISIKDEAKDTLFDLIQNAYKLEIDFLKMKNGDLPTIKELLNKSSTWTCSCGEIDNALGKIICKSCSKYRPLETYTNIIFNPMLVTKTEIKEFHMRRRHEAKVYQSLMKRNMENKKDIYFYAIEASWLNKWKCFVSNDLSEKIMSNNEKHISDNKLVGVLPPGIINNIKICDIYKPHGKYRIKSGLKNKKDYFIINQYLWEWFLLNYSGGPEIPIDGYSSNLFSIEEDVGRTDKIVENNGSIFGGRVTYGCIGDFDSNESIEKKQDYYINQTGENTNKINSVGEYNFNTKFSEFRNNKEKEKRGSIADKKNNNSKGKEGNKNIKQLQIKNLISNINIEENKEK